MAKKNLPKKAGVKIRSVRQPNWYPTQRSALNSNKANDIGWLDNRYPNWLCIIPEFMKPKRA
ncbi:hypothetical protein Y888_17465 [Mixta calida B021323]|nr:hypothetical protein PSNIH2_16545 [Pantoea sp. PSNIH2]KAF0858272.1 hypothetical protein Y888_17465 [Mixta calida B021323]POU44882.1 hypothetical protein C3380_17835 [Pantoea sp. PSNIH5]POU63683.1 hypothetical protein C3374_17630 [Pantoea sp. PSNIH4]